MFIVFSLFIFQDPTTGIEYDSDQFKVIRRVPNKVSGDVIIKRSVVSILGGTKSDDSAFFPCRQNIKTLQFESWSLIENIGSWVFAYSSLISADFSNCDNLLILSNSLFSGCTSLKTVILPPNVNISLNVPDSLEIIDGWRSGDNYMFSSNIAEFNLSPNSNLISIGNGVFDRCKLTYFYIGKNVTKIEPAFTRCSIDHFDIHPENKKFKVDKNIIYTDTDNSTLLYASIQGDFIVPSFVKTIYGNAFQGSGLTSIDVPDSVTYIDTQAFSFTQLKQFTFPSKITRVTERLFRSCTLLTTVTLTESITSIDLVPFKF